MWTKFRDSNVVFNALIAVGFVSTRSNKKKKINRIYACVCVCVFCSTGTCRHEPRLGRILKEIFSGKKKTKKTHMSPYLDNEFLLIARTRQDSKRKVFHCLTCSQIWLNAFVDDHQSTYLTIIK
jgi:hypothetical protein